MADILLGTLRDIWRDNKDAAEAVETLLQTAGTDDVGVLIESLEGKDFATQATLNDLLTNFNAEDFASETTLSSIDGKVATEATLDTRLSSLETKMDTLLNSQDEDNNITTKQSGSSVSFNFTDNQIIEPAEIISFDEIDDSFNIETAASIQIMVLTGTGLDLDDLDIIMNFRRKGDSWGITSTVSCSYIVGETPKTEKYIMAAGTAGINNRVMSTNKMPLFANETRLRIKNNTESNIEIRGRNYRVGY